MVAGDGIIGTDGKNGSELLLRCLPPLLLRQEVHTALLAQGIDYICSKRFREDHPALFWNMVWLFRAFGLNVAFLLPVSERVKSMFAKGGGRKERRGRKEGERRGDRENRLSGEGKEKGEKTKEKEMAAEAREEKIIMKASDTNEKEEKKEEGAAMMEDCSCSHRGNESDGSNEDGKRNPSSLAVSSVSPSSSPSKAKKCSPVRSRKQTKKSRRQSMMV